MATINALSPSYIDVNNAVVSAVDEDTVAIPAGTAAWASTLTISKAITLQGASATLDGNGRATSCSTVIQYSLPGGVYAPPAIQWNLVANKTSRMTQIEFSGGTAGPNSFAVVRVDGGSNANSDNRRMRIDHCVWDHAGQDGCIALHTETVLGVMDHCTVNMHFGKFLELDCSFWNGFDHGDGAWADPDNFGTDKFFFVENNTLNNDGTSPQTGTDGQHGGRVVYRYNTINRGNFQCHGTEAIGTRGGRAYEVYNNTFNSDDNSTGPVTARSGVWIIHDNIISANTGFGSGGSFNLNEFAAYQGSAIPFNGPDGRNPWHRNNGANPFVTRTITNVISPNSARDNTKTWTLDAEYPSTVDTFGQWSGYTIRKVSGPTVFDISSLTRSGPTITVTTTAPHGFSSGNVVAIWGANQYHYNNLWNGITVTGANTFTASTINTFSTAATPATGTMHCTKGGSYGTIRSNLADGTLVWNVGANGQAFTITFAVGDTYEINKVDQAMDQCGSGQGSYVNLDMTAPPLGWNDQTTSPCYEWGNTLSGTHTYFDTKTDFSGGHYGTIREGVHFKNNTVKPGYSTFTYPHPLTSGGGGGPTPLPPLLFIQLYP